MWFENVDSDWTKKYILKLIKAAYDVRSKVAHGNLPTKTKYNVGTDSLTIDQLATQSREVIMNGIRKALFEHCPLGNPVYPPDWEKLILGEDK